MVFRGEKVDVGRVARHGTVGGQHHQFVVHRDARTTVVCAEVEWLGQGHAAVEGQPFVGALGPSEQLLPRGCDVAFGLGFGSAGEKEQRAVWGEHGQILVLIPADFRDGRWLRASCVHVELIQEDQFWQRAFHIAAPPPFGHVLRKGQVGLKLGKGQFVVVVHVGHGAPEVQRLRHASRTNLLQRVQVLGQLPPHVGVSAGGLECQLGSLHSHGDVFWLEFECRFEAGEPVFQRGLALGVKGFVEELLRFGRPRFLWFALCVCRVECDAQTQAQCHDAAHGHQEPGFNSPSD